MKGYLTSKEVEEYLGLAYGSVRVLAQRGMLPSIKRGRDRFYHVDDVEHYRRTHRRYRAQPDQKELAAEKVG